MATSLDTPQRAASDAAFRVRAGGQWFLRASGLAGAALLTVLLARALLFTHADPGWDQEVHLWYLWHAEGSLRANGLPSLFVHDTGAVFNPHFAFYGGTLNLFAGVLALVLGSASAAYGVTYALAFAAAYGGWFWLARMAGLGWGWSHVPAALFVTSPYYLGVVYWRGDWPEFVAVSTIPIVMAAAISILRAERLRPLPALVLAVSSALFVGSHNITLLWGTTVMAVVAGLLCLLVPAARRQVSGRGLLRVAAVVVPALLVNAWFLLPDLAYQSHTFIGAEADNWRSSLRGYDNVVDAGHLFSLTRAPISVQTPSFALELPVLALAWAILGLLVLRPRGMGPWVRTLLILVATFAGLLVVMTSAGLLLSLPGPYGLVQYSFRLESYLLLLASGAVLAALVLALRAPPRRRRWAFVIVAVVALSVVQGLRQGDMHRAPSSPVAPWPALPPYHTGGAPPGANDYVGHDLPELPTTPSTARAVFPTSAERGDRASIVVDAQPGQLLVTNAMTVPQLVRLKGARFVGVDDGRHNIIQVDAGARPGAARITLSAAHPWPVVAGWVLSGIGIAVLVADGVFMLMAWRRRRASIT